MLTAELIRGFWCECWTEGARALEGRENARARRAAFGAQSAAQADGWLSKTLGSIARALNQSMAMETWEVFYEGRIDTRRALLRAEHCTASMTNAHTRITWTIRPVLFLPLADDRETELPACSADFSFQATD